MRSRFTVSTLAVAAALICQPYGIALAQDAPPEPEQDGDDSAVEPPETDDDLDTIVVIGTSLAGRVDAAEPPILSLDEDEIAAYGAGSIAELVQSLGPEISSGRGSGPPVFLVNGVRISSFRELRSYPPEVIERTEVLSEEVAQQYGYSADQRVVNFILKDNFQTLAVELEYNQLFDGGLSGNEVEATYLRIDGPNRINLNVEAEDVSTLTEGERGIIQSTGGAPILASDPDPANFRTLVSDTSSYQADVNWTTGLGEGGDSLSLNGSYERNNSLSLQGLDSVVLTDPNGDTLLRTFNSLNPLAVDRTSDSYSLGGGIATRVGLWELNLTADANLTDTLTRIQQRIDTSDLVTSAANGTLALDAELGPFGEAGFDEAESSTYRVASLATARGILLALPAGDVNATLSANFVANGIESTDTRNPGIVTDLDRQRLGGAANLAIPLTSRDEDFGGAVGDFTLNLNASLSDVSDFGTLYSLSAGLTWGITDTLTLGYNRELSEEAPSLTQLGSPQIATPNVPVFDIVNNETVLATVISGGNDALPARSQDDWRVSLNWQMPILDRASMRLEYFNNSSEDVTEGFPLLTPEIEAAFPDRITRDSADQLITLDNRFVTFAERDVERVRLGLFLGGEINPRGSDENEGDAPPGEGRRGPPPGAGGPGGGGRAAQFAAMRERFCSTEPDVLIDLFNRALAAQAAGEDPPLDENGEPIYIPPQMLQRLAGEDGQIDPERFASVRERICGSEGRPQAGQGGGGGNRGGRRGGRGFRGGFGGGDGPPVIRWFANLTYSLELEDSVLIAPGLARLDLLDGDALSGGGTARNSVNFRSGAFYDGWGTLLFADYQGSSRINGSGLQGSTDLFFSDNLTVNWRGFVDLSERTSLIESAPFLDNVRISVRVDNLFDSRQSVVDSNGETPLRYQPFLIDPRGRSFGVEVRKLF
ncbi:TonB-dependent receptor [Aurantiacibacter sediminis]|uniref:TonB-dependent receptor n=1 Tax=Aurantiacibacter sediminis TaxID=2793064 RepID=A0ABS0N5N3_9SPHN|nr:hypothetical protein [Aurantiacibacter sediminis]MBH5323109.1 hypothetical protein [Aurantiacibacter sediminis]